jgi:hypothetical protein
MKPMTVLQAGQWSSAGCGRLGEQHQIAPAVLPGWHEVCARPFERFPRLDPLSKLVCILSEWALEAQPVSPDLGLILASRFGCVEADLAYYRTAAKTPELASPQLFPYTLPSAGLAEVAIRHQLHGPSLVLLQDNGLEAALCQAQRWLENDEAPQCLLLQADALLAEGAHLLQAKPGMEGWAFLLEPGAGPRTLPAWAGAGQVLPADLFAALEKAESRG